MRDRWWFRKECCGGLGEKRVRAAEGPQALTREKNSSRCLIKVKKSRDLFFFGGGVGQVINEIGSTVFLKLPGHFLSHSNKSGLFETNKKRGGTETEGKFSTSESDLSFFHHTWSQNSHETIFQFRVSKMWKIQRN